MAVIIGMDPHKRSVTIEVINELGATTETGKFGTDQFGYAEILAAGVGSPSGYGRWKAVTASVGISRTT